MIVIDTTVLLYAVGGEHPLADPCRRLIAAIEHRHLDATTAVDAIQEFAHVYARQRERREAARLARRFAELLSPLLLLTREDLEEGLGLFERHPRLGAFDALLAAAALQRASEALISADIAFGEVPRLRLLRPGTAPFEGLLKRATGAEQT